MTDNRTDTLVSAAWKTVVGWVEEGLEAGRAASGLPTAIRRVDGAALLEATGANKALGRPEPVGTGEVARYAGTTPEAVRFSTRRAATPGWDDEALRQVAWGAGGIGRTVADWARDAVAAEAGHVVRCLGLDHPGVAPTSGPLTKALVEREAATRRPGATKWIVTSEPDLPDPVRAAFTGGTITIVPTDVVARGVHVVTEVRTGDAGIFDGSAAMALTWERSDDVHIHVEETLTQVLAGAIGVTDVADLDLTWHVAGQVHLRLERCLAVDVVRRPAPRLLQP